MQQSDSYFKAWFSLYFKEQTEPDPGHIEMMYIFFSPRRYQYIGAKCGMVLVDTDNVRNL